MRRWCPCEWGACQTGLDSERFRNRSRKLLILHSVWWQIRRTRGHSESKRWCHWFCEVSWALEREFKQNVIDQKNCPLIAPNWMWGHNEVITCKLPRLKSQFPWELLFVVKVNPLNPPFNYIWIHLVCLLSFNQSSRRSQHSYPSKVTGWLPGWNYTFAPSPVRFMKRLVEN